MTTGRRLLAAGAFVCGLTGAVALMHIPRGGPLAGAVASYAGVFCPARKVTLGAAEELRVRGVSALRGKDKAPARPALGWPLDVGREDNVMLWARNVGVRCTPMQTPTRVLRCSDVPGSAFPWGAREGIIDEVAFGFAPDGRLVAVQTLRRALTGLQAARLYGQIADDLEARLGRKAEQVGTATAAHLEATPMNTARLRYRFADYLATVTAMNLSGRVGLREQYLSATDGES
jgi:hypothetical protein